MWTMTGPPLRGTSSHFANRLLILVECTSHLLQKEKNILCTRHLSTPNSLIVKSNRCNLRKPPSDRACMCESVYACVLVHVFVSQLPLLRSPHPGSGGGEIRRIREDGEAVKHIWSTNLRRCTSPPANYLECAEGQRRAGCQSCRRQSLLIAGCRPTVLHCEVTGAASTALHHVVTFTLTGFNVAILTAIICILHLYLQSTEAHFWKS